MPQSKPPLLLLCKSAITTSSLEKILSPLFQLNIVQDAESTWKKITQMDEICILVSDLSIAIDQYGLMERLRKAQDEMISAIPVLLLVGAEDDESQREKAFHDGASDFITMPFSSSELLSRLELQGRRLKKHTLNQLPSDNNNSPADLLLNLTQQKCFDDRLIQELSFAVRHKVNLSVVKLKLDQFDIITKHFEQPIVSKILNRVAEILQKTIRREDMLCYQGKAEFMILLPATNSLGAMTGLHRLKTSFEREKVKVLDRTLPISFSGGIFSNLSNKEASVEDVYSQLDHKLNKAIESGGNNIVSAKQTQDTEFLTIDQALKLIASGNTESLKPEAARLLQKIMPLLQFADQNLSIDLEETNQYLKIYFDV